MELGDVNLGVGGDREGLRWENCYSGGEVSGHQTSSRLWERDAPLSRTLHSLGPQQKQRPVENSRPREGSGRGAPRRCSPVPPPPAPPGGVSVRRLSDWLRLEIPGRALEASRSAGLATLADGRGADTAGSSMALAAWGAGLSLGSPGTHWLSAVSLGTWRRRGPGPPSGWAGGRREPW